MKKINKKLPVVLSLLTLFPSYEAIAATKLTMTAPAAALQVKTSVLASGACSARVQVKVDAIDIAKKTSSAVTTTCDSSSKYKAQLNLSSLKDGVIQVRASQVVSRVTSSASVSIVKNTAITPTTPTPTPVPPATSTTPDPFLTQVFSNNSPWNTPIVNNPELEPKTAEMMQLVKTYVASGGYSVSLGLNYKQWTAPLHFIDSTTAPKLTVYFDTVKTGTTEGFHNSVDPTGIGEVPNIPLPSWVWPDPKTDGHMVLYDKATGTIYEFSRFRWDNGKAYATRVAIIDSTSSGVDFPFDGSRWWMKNVRGSGLPFIGGLIRYSEFQSGEINHAVSFAGPTNRLKKLATNTWTKELCGPLATRTDGWEVGENTILEGARLQLNPNLNLDTLGLSADAKIVARAMQKYGGFMADNGETFSIYFENLGPANSYKWEQTGLGDLSKIPLDQFRVLKCNDIRTR